MSGVAMRGLGQPSTARAGLAVRHNLEGTELHSCTIFGNSGITLAGATTASITSSFVAGTDGSSIAVWNDDKHAGEGYTPPLSSNITLTDNIAAWARPLGVSVVMDEVANFVLCPFASGCTVNATGNIGAGSANYGYVLGYALAAVTHATIHFSTCTASCMLPCCTGWLQTVKRIMLGLFPMLALANVCACAIRCFPSRFFQAAQRVPMP